jgi:hypothetical protein
MKKIMILFIFSSILALNISQSYAGWLIYHKPEFKGRVIDAETKRPIEGAVAVVVYYKHSLISGPGGGYTSVVKVKETLTDKNGEFSFPAYTTLIQPNSIEDYARFIIYKPGYGNFPNQQILPSGLPPVNEQEFFSKEIGSEGELEMWAKEERDYQLRERKVIFGIVELTKMKSTEERLRAIPSTPTDIRSKELPLLYKIMNEEGRRFGLGEQK